MTKARNVKSVTILLDDGFQITMPVDFMALLDRWQNAIAQTLIPSEMAIKDYMVRRITIEAMARIPEHRRNAKPTQIIWNE